MTHQKAGSLQYIIQWYGHCNIQIVGKSYPRSTPESLARRCLWKENKASKAFSFIIRRFLLYLFSAKWYLRWQFFLSHRNCCFLNFAIAFYCGFIYNNIRFPGVAQLVARLTGGQEAASSSLVTRTTKNRLKPNGLGGFCFFQKGEKWHEIW